MAGTGKYTVYAPAGTDRNQRLNKLFGHDENPFKDMVGQETNARLATVALGVAKLQPVLQSSGDQSVSNFGGGDIGFGYAESPATEDVVWASAGDPANPYTPELRSPGPGITDAMNSTTLQADPAITPQDIVGQGFTEPGDTKTEWAGEASPAATKVVVKSSAELGKNIPLGTSDEIKPFS